MRSLIKARVMCAGRICAAKVKHSLGHPMSPADLLTLKVPSSAWTDALSAAEYHGRHEISCHKLLDFEESPRRFRNKYVTVSNKDRRTSAMEFGELFHQRVLEPELFNARTVGPEKTRNTKDWRQFKILVPDGVHFKDKQLAGSMYESLMEHREARRLLENPLRRVELTGFLPFRGLPMKLRCDLITDDYIIDVKTAESASDKAFGFAADKYGYLFQACLYLTAAELIDGKKRKFYFVVCEKVSPFECAVYEVPDAVIEKEMDRLVTVVDELRTCLETDNWGFRNEAIKPLWLTNYYFERLYEVAQDV